MAEWLIESTGRQRRRRRPAGSPTPPDAWPAAWRALAAPWLRRDSARVKWATLLASGGHAAYETAHDLLEGLLEGGWVVVEERWQAGRWQALWVEFLDAPALRRALGLPVPGARLAAQQQARADLLAALDRWQTAATRPAQATRRDFAQFARGDTKGIGSAEWDWLETQVDLAACGIGAHTPLLCLVAPINLFLPQGRLDLAATPDFLGLSPATLTAAGGGDHAVSQWTLVENRTSFERCARARSANEGVLWLPGFPPGWWQTAVARLLQLAPAPARIACDPDPAGIDIALTAGKLWQAGGLDWQPWCMADSDLAGLPIRKSLTERDRERLAVLTQQALPPALRQLADWMILHDEKGEQEGYL